MGMLQISGRVTARWSEKNDMRINPDKTKAGAGNLPLERQGHRDSLPKILVNGML